MIHLINFYSFLKSVFCAATIISVMMIQLRVEAQDIIHLKDGSSVTCQITKITDFILYAETKESTEPLTFFSEDVRHLDIDRKNDALIWQLQQGFIDAHKLSEVSEDSIKNIFYFGMPYDSIFDYWNAEKKYKLDSLGNTILVPYNPVETPFSERLESLIKSLGGKRSRPLRED